jgi:MFS family permease
MESQDKTTVVGDNTEQVGTFTVFGQTDFRWLFLGAILANAAQWIQQVTMGWLIYDITASGTMLGTLNLVRSFATLGLAPVAGVAIDRASRRTLMFITNSWFLLNNAVLGIVLLAGYTQIWPLFVFTLLGGMAMAIDQPLRQTVLFTLVPRSLVPSAVALLQTGWALMRTLGPAIGGFLIVWIGPGGNFLVQGAAFALITLTIPRLNFSPTTSTATKTAAFSNIKDGLRFVLSDTNTRTFFLMGWILSICIIPIFVVMPPIYAKDIFGGGPQVLGSLLSAVGVGGIVGGLVVANLKKVDRRGLVELAGLFLLSLSLIGFAISTNLWVALVLFGMAGFFEMIFIITNQTSLQLSIPDGLRGRVNGIIMLSSGLVPIGSLIAGIGADTIGPRPTAALFSGAAGVIAIIVFLTSPTVRNYRLSRVLVVEDPIQDEN